MQDWRFSWPDLVVFQLLPTLLCEFLQVLLLVLASDLDLTDGVNRGVSPADTATSSLRSRRPRRVEDAATSTRLGPLKVHSVDTAAACGRLFSPSGEVEVSVDAAADHVHHRRSQGPTCYFSFFRVLSVFLGQLSHVWNDRVVSCFLT